MQLLKQLYAIHSPSGKEQRMRNYLIRWIRRHIPEATITTDPIGNIYVTKGESFSFPCIVSHIDQVQKTHSTDFQAVETRDIIFGYSSKNKRQEGLGADDKNGIWICLQCLKRYPIIKAAFFVQEETGCIGSQNADLSFFGDARFVLQSDRRGSSDIITSIWGDLCSESFLAAIDYPAYHYKPTHGLPTDVGTLKEKGLNVSVVNLSCGYYEPHTDHEITVKKDLINCLNFIYHIIDTCTDSYPHESYGCEDGWVIDDDPFVHDEEYDELSELIGDYLEYQPDMPADIFHELYHDYFPHLQLKDYQNIINDYNYERTTSSDTTDGDR